MGDDPVVRIPLRVLSDYNLPGTDGAALAARHPGIPFVLMTGLPPDRSPRAAMTPSVTARLVKPLDVPNLLAVLREAVTARRAMREANRALSGIEHSTSAPTEEG